MGNQQILVLFLKALIAAKKSLSLYPPGSEMATAWVRRLHRSLDGFFQEGMTFPIRVGKDRFHWAGEELLTIEATLEAFRFDLEARGIVEFSIDPSVEDWELEAFLDLLNQPAESFDSVAGASALLGRRKVVHITVREPTGGAGVEAEEARPEEDELDRLVHAILERTEEHFGALSYDRDRLLGWFHSLTDDGRVDVLYPAVQLLGTMAGGAGDRDVRLRTVTEAVLNLPDAILRPFLTNWLVPLAASDVVAFNLLAQATEDEMGRIAKLVPADLFMSLTGELLEFPVEAGKRQRLLEAVTAALERRRQPGLAPGPAEELAHDDPLFVELREEILAACHSDVLLERSADILLALIFRVDGDEYPAFAVDALEEIMGEALARGRLDLAVNVLKNLSTTTQLGTGWMRDHPRRYALFMRRMASRTHISLVAGILRRRTETQQMALAAEYLRAVGREGADEFSAVLAEEGDRRVRARLCQVLATVGPSVVPALLPRLTESRWYVVRNVVGILGKIGDESTFLSVVNVLDHPHPRVRLEAVRALGVIGGRMAVTPLIRCLDDPDPTVRGAAVRALGALQDEEAVAALHGLVTRPGLGAPDDLAIRHEAINALAAIGTPEARRALSELASRRVWFWNRVEKRIRDMAAEALRASRHAMAGAMRDGDDG